MSQEWKKGQGRKFAKDRPVISEAEKIPAELKCSYVRKMFRQIFNPLIGGTYSMLTCLLLSFFILSLATPTAKIGSRFNPIQIENQLPGSRDWQLTNPAPYNNKTFDFPAIEGYAWTTSAEAGDKVQFSVSTEAPSFRADVYRMGWYQGKGGRLIASMPFMPGHKYTFSAPEPHIGLIATNWPIAFTLKTYADWVTGMYMVKLTASTGFQAYIPLVIRSSRPSDFAFIHAVNTDEAYNYWGGTSLYEDKTKSLDAMRAFKVSFDRPFQQDTGAGQFFWWEYPMVRWLEHHGYDLSYLSDLDIQNLPSPLENYHALLIVGHNEYWSRQMRDHLEAAVNNRVNLALFAANSIYWQARYEPRLAVSAIPALAERILVCYKDASVDPLYRKNNRLVTVQFRDDPLDDPEQPFLGAMYGGYLGDKLFYFPWVVANPSSWVFAGTSLKKGDSLPGLVGYEYDKVFSNYPSVQGLDILSASPVITHDGKHDISNTTLYTATSGSRVFDAGTIQWSWGLDNSSTIAGIDAVNATTQKITTNILQNFRIVANKPNKLQSHPSNPNVVNLYITAVTLLISCSLFLLMYKFFAGKGGKNGIASGK